MGGEFPTFEYERRQTNPTIEEDIITSTFELIWEQFSIPLSIHKARGMAETFEDNLRLLRENM